MELVVSHWDAFARAPGKGNPAGIVFDAVSLSDRQMQTVASQIGFNDTAFVLPSESADLRLRYFGPRREVELCGHATIAAFFALRSAGRLPLGRRRFTLETRNGVLPIEFDENAELGVVMTQARSQFAAFKGDRACLARALGLDASDLHATLPILYGSTGRWTLVVPIKTIEAMQRMHPAPEHFAEVLADQPGASIHPFCLATVDPSVHMHARHFSAPSSGTLEDAVTGTASGVLGAYYCQFVDARRQQPLLVEQGLEIGRDGRVRVWAQRQGDAFVVRIAGAACFVRDISVAVADD